MSARARSLRLLLPLLALLLGTLSCRELGVLSVSPGVVPAGQRSEVRVTGYGFAEDVVLGLESGGVSVGLAPLFIEGPDAATGQVPPATPPGTYDVVAEAEGVRASLADGLRVVSGEMRVTFIDVGQGDATLVVAPGGETLLIDGGRESSGADVRAVIEREAAGRLDAIVLSHVDADHLAGLVGVLSGPDGVAGSADDLSPEIALGPRDDGSCDTQTCGRMRQLAAWPFEVAVPARSFALGDVEVEIVAADGVVATQAVAGANDQNERSVAVLVRFGGRTVLVTGDLTGGGEGTADVETPLAALTGPVDVLRTSHHGSRTSSAPAALATWAPRAAVFSFGTDNAYCHPHQEVLDRVASAAGAVYATGAGVVVDVARCGSATVPPQNARLGLGDVLLRVDNGGTMILADDAL